MRTNGKSCYHRYDEKRTRVSFGKNWMWKSHGVSMNHWGLSLNKGILLVFHVFLYCCWWWWWRCVISSCTLNMFFYASNIEIAWYACISTADKELIRSPVVPITRQSISSGSHWKSISHARTHQYIDWLGLWWFIFCVCCDVSSPCRLA